MIEISIKIVFKVTSSQIGFRFCESFTWNRTLLFFFFSRHHNYAKNNPLRKLPISKNTSGFTIPLKHEVALNAPGTRNPHRFPRGSPPWGATLIGPELLMGLVKKASASNDIKSQLSARKSLIKSTFALLRTEGRATCFYARTTKGRNLKN